MSSPSAHRLPDTVRPERYVLTLEPDLAQFTFQGSETISINVHAPTSRIVLNAAELDVTSASVVLPDGTTLRADAQADEDAERATITVNGELPVGKAELQLELHSASRASSVKPHRSEKRQMRGERRGRVERRGRGSARSHHVLGVAVVLVEAGADGERRVQPAERAPHHAHVAHRCLELLVVRQLRGTRRISGQPAGSSRQPQPGLKRAVRAASSGTLALTAR